MITLAIDASTYAGDVAVLDDDRLLAEKSTAMRDPEHERLMPAVAEVLEIAGLTIRQVDRVVCGAGPGSFTSLRIAGGIAKGICAGAGRPLSAVPSMALIVGGARLASGRYLAAVDALRGEYYVGLYHVNASREVIQIEAPRLVPADTVARVAWDYESKIVSPTPMDDAVRADPKARAVAYLEAWLNDTGPVDLASWEPSYGRLAEAQVKWETQHGRPLRLI